MFAGRSLEKSRGSPAVFFIKEGLGFRGLKWGFRGGFRRFGGLGVGGLGLGFRVWGFGE